MKFIKLFESIADWGVNKYNLGDYIITTYNFKIHYSETIVGSVLCGKIIEIDKQPVPYLIELLRGDMWVRENMITRKMTKEEIEEFELLSSTIKYNL